MLTLSEVRVYFLTHEDTRRERRTTQEPEHAAPLEAAREERLQRRVR